MTKKLISTPFGEPNQLGATELHPFGFTRGVRRLRDMLQAVQGAFGKTKSPNSSLCPTTTQYLCATIACLMVAVGLCFSQSDSSKVVVKGHFFGETAKEFATIAELNCDRIEKLKPKAVHKQGVVGDVQTCRELRIAESGRRIAVYRLSEEEPFNGYGAEFNKGRVVKLMLQHPVFSDVLNELSTRFGTPSKLDQNSFQDEVGAIHELRSAAWDLSDGAKIRAIEGFLNNTSVRGTIVSFYAPGEVEKAVGDLTKGKSILEK
jgi:hypothetical protein